MSESANERHEAFAVTHAAILARIAGDAPLDEILAASVALVETHYPACLCSVLLLDHDGKHLVHEVAPSLPPAFVTGIDGREIGPVAGSCGTAAFENRTVVVTDIAHDPLWERYRTLALESGLAACWSVPIVSSTQRVLGTFAAYSRTARSPEPGELATLVACAHLASIAIERRRSSEEQRANDLLLRVAGHAAKLGGWAVDLVTRKLSWSDEVALIHESQPGSSPSLRRALEFYAPEYRERARLTFQACALEGTAFDEEMQVITAKGRRIWVRAIGEAVRDARGRITRIQGAFQDVTDRKRAEEAERRGQEQLEASEAQYRLLFESNPHPMWAYDTETLRVIAVNRSAIAHYGYTEAEFLTMSIRDLRAPGSADMMERKGRSIPPFEKNIGVWQHRRKDGSILDVEIISDRVDLNGRPARLVLANDVTVRLRAERELARVSRAREMLSACSDALIRAQEERALLEKICSITIDIGGYQLASIGLSADGAARTMASVAHAGAVDAFVADLGVDLTAESVFVLGPAGRSIRTGKVVVVKDLAQDPAFEPFVSAGRVEGYGGVVCLPLRERDRTFGALSLYAPEVREIGADEVRLLQELADDVAFGISNIRARDERRRLQAAVLKVVAGVSAATGTEFFEQLARNMAEALGAQGGVVARLLPNDPLGARTVAAVLDGEVLANFEHRIEGTPCEHMLGLDDCVVLVGERARFHGVPAFSSLDMHTYVGRRLFDSGERPLGFLYVLFRGPLAQPEFVTSTLQIFASRAAAELERQDADARIREQASLLDKAKDAIIVRDIDQHITFWNKGAERLYGYVQAEVLGRSLEELLYSDPSDFRVAFARLLSVGEWNGEIVQRRKDGTSITIEGHWTLVRDADGAPQSVLSINTDVTKRLAVEAQLQQSQRLESIGQLTGGVAHDFNNLLTVILGNAEVLSEELSDDPDRRQLAEMVRVAALRGGELTHRLLTFARRQALRPKAVDTSALVAEMLGLLRRTLSEDIDVQILAEQGVLPALVDPSQLEDALLNLSINARDAMSRAGGTLTIATKNARLDKDYADKYPGVVPGPYVLVSVTDTGTGISPEHLPKIFDPFFTTKEFGKGTGLGLSMVYGFIQQSRGHVQVMSQEGQGTTVRMYFPVAAGEAVQTGEQGDAVINLGGSETILLVEDDTLVRKHVAEQLRDLGYVVLAASNGPEALSLFAAHPEVELIFTDVIMPGGMNGRSLADAALRMRPGIKVLFTSGYTDDANVQRKDAPREHILPKPYRRGDLARAVRVALARIELNAS